MVVATRIDYRDYMKSEQWKAVSRVVKVRANWSCQICGGQNVNLSAHHSSYDRLATPKEIEDCIAVCNRCHKLIHECVLDH